MVGSKGRSRDTHSTRRAPPRSWTRSRVHWGWCPASGPHCASFRCLDPPTPCCKCLRLYRCLSGACPGVRSCVRSRPRRLQTAGQAALSLLALAPFFTHRPPGPCSPSTHRPARQIQICEIRNSVLPRHATIRAILTLFPSQSNLNRLNAPTLVYQCLIV